jgi:hypothetical protein
VLAGEERGDSALCRLCALLCLLLCWCQCEYCGEWHCVLLPSFIEAAFVCATLLLEIWNCRAPKQIWSFPKKCGCFCLLSLTEHTHTHTHTHTHLKRKATTHKHISNDDTGNRRKTTAEKESHALSMHAACTSFSCLFPTSAFPSNM